MSVTFLTDKDTEQFEKVESRVTTIDAASDNKHYPTAKAVYEALPANKLVGTSDNPIILEELATGLYNITGYYKFISTGDLRSTPAQQLLIVQCAEDRTSSKCTMFTHSSINYCRIKDGSILELYSMPVYASTNSINSAIDEGRDLAKLYPTAKAVYDFLGNIATDGDVSAGRNGFDSYKLLAETVLTEDAKQIKWTQTSTGEELTNYKDFFILWSGRFTATANEAYICHSNNGAKYHCYTQLQKTEGVNVGGWFKIDEIYISEDGKTGIVKSTYPNNFLRNISITNSMTSQGLADNNRPVSSDIAMSEGSYAPTSSIVFGGASSSISLFAAGTKAILLGRPRVSKSENDIKSGEKYFNIDSSGVVSLKPEYRGCPLEIEDIYIGTALTAEEREIVHANAFSDLGVGVNGSKNYELPDTVVIPNEVNGTKVTSLAAGMFYGNKRVKEITIPTTVTAIPLYFGYEAINLKEIHNIEQVTSIGTFIVGLTQIDTLELPALSTVAIGAFANAFYLRVIDIGNNISEIPMRTFYNNMSLSQVKGGGNISIIGQEGFQGTLSLKKLSFLSQVTSIGKRAFLKSRIQFDWDSIAGQCTFGTQATPVIDNTVKYWDGVKPIPCENKLVTKLWQSNPEWKDEVFGDSGKIYNGGCAVFTTLHIHSALSGNLYAHPDEFAEELRAIDPSLVTLAKHPTNFNNVPFLFDALGYKTTVYTSEPGVINNDTTIDNITVVNTTSITQTVYQDICNALARGAYVYMQISTAGLVDSGHVVTIYGISGNGEVLVLDSGTLNGNILTYRMPIQNLTGPSSDIVIVEKNE